MSNYDHDSYDQNYKRERNKNRNTIVNKFLNTDESKTDTTTKVQPKHGNYTGQRVGKFYIKNLSNNKRRRPSILEEEDKQILRDAFGSDGSGVTKTDERTFYYDQGVFY